MLTAARPPEAAPRVTVPTLIYDGACGFCSRWVSRVQKWDRAGAVRYLPLQDPEAPVIAGVSRTALQQAAHFVRQDGAVFAGARAARELLRCLPGGWLPGLVFRIPGAMPIAERTYRYIARRWGPVS